MSDTLQESLRKCSSYANEGYKRAKESCDKVRLALLNEEQALFKVEDQQNQMRRLENTYILDQQKDAIREFSHKLDKIENDLKRLHENNKDFSIVVFGRTMAGKSTLMEILTHGNGASIGNGSQRTTRDVRDYEWQGLKITDVPGIASFGDEGREDDRLAIDAAKAADLIIFLITDDAPQQEEAQRLAELLNLGKPVLGVVNVKATLNLNKRALGIRTIQRKLADTERLQSIQDQFKAYARDFNQDWQNIEFVYTHLRAAFLSNFENNTDEELFALSNFSQVEEHILNKVHQDGCFLRIKTFIDNAVIPMQKQMELLLEHSSESTTTALTYRYKWHELDDWLNSFKEKVQQKQNAFGKNFKNYIDHEIWDFAEYHYDDEQAGDSWNAKVEKMNLEQRCTDFLMPIANEAERKRRESTDDLKTEINFSTGNFDIGSIGGFDTTSFKGLFSIGALGAGLLLSGPIGLVAAGALGLFSLFSDSKSEKIREAKRKMRQEIHKQMDPAIDNILTKISNIIDDEIIGKGIYGLRQNLVDRDEMLFALAANQQKSARKLNDNLFDLNADLFIKASIYVNCNDKYCIYYIPRIPGQICYGIGPGNASMDTCNKIAKLLGEKVCYIPLPGEEGDTPKIWDIIEDWVGDWHDKTLEFGKDGKIRYLCLSSNPNYEDIKNKSEFRLVQQVRCQPFINI